MHSAGARPAGISVGVIGGGSAVPRALLRYERLRIRRTAQLQATSATNKTRFHLPDGPEQQERDAQMAEGSTDWSFDAVAWIYDYDAAAVGR